MKRFYLILIGLFAITFLMSSQAGGVCKPENETCQQVVSATTIMSQVSDKILPLTSLFSHTRLPYPLLTPEQYHKAGLIVALLFLVLLLAFRRHHQKTARLDDDVYTMLNLARGYLEMDQAKRAKKLIKRVLRSSDEQARREARTLLDDMST